MKYVMLDTNIFLEMLVDRNNKISPELMGTFIKLLDYDEIKLVIPQIITVETYRHLEDEIQKVGTNIQAVIKSTKELYGVNTYTINGLDIREYKKEACKQLNAAKLEFKENRDKYIEELCNIMEKVFAHKNCIIIQDDDFLCSAVVKRRIYKKAPFHIEQKESFADGLIAETLIHIKNYVDIEDVDEIIFVTRNYKDFSNTHGKADELHPDIIADLKYENINEVVYVREFGKLIREVLKDNVIAADLAAEFQKELEEEEAEEKALWESDMEDLAREGVGLSALSSFGSNFEDEFADSDFHDTLVSLFERLGAEYRVLEEYSYFYTEEVYSQVSATKFADIPHLLQTVDKYCNCLEDPYHPEYNIGEVEVCTNWIIDQNNLVNHGLWETKSKDYIEFNDVFPIYNPEGVRYVFTLDELYLSPADGSTDQIDMRIMDASGENQANGYIEITYGFVEVDEDGGIGDGCEESVEYRADEIYRFIENIIKEWEAFNKEQVKIIEELRTELL